MRSPRAAAGTGSPASARSAISTSWAGAIGRAPARQNLIPLYSAGVVAGGEHGPRAGPVGPEANQSSSVLASPMSTTSAPRLSTPSMKAAAISGPLTRMSRPTTSAPSAAFRSSVSTRAAPTAYAPAVSHCGSGPSVTPRMSLALKIARVIIAAILRCHRG